MNWYKGIEVLKLMMPNTCTSITECNDVLLWKGTLGLIPLKM